MPTKSLYAARQFIALGLIAASFGALGAGAGDGAKQSQAHGAFNLDGLWFEADNYPASSVLRFTPYGNGWTGRYVQVSPPQHQIGFNVGEVVIRGMLKDNGFVGEVLLKPVRDDPLCDGLTVGWVPIRMSFDGPDKLSGMWRQIWVAGTQGCVVVDQSWQPYRLERLPLH